MRKDLRWKVILVIVLTVICAWGVVPPKEKIRLGLDLKGGIHLAMRVEVNDAVKAVLDTRASGLTAELKKRGLKTDGVRANLETSSIVIENYDKVARDEFLKLIESDLPGYKVTEEGNSLRITLPPLEVDRIKEDAVVDTLERVRNRVDAFGIAEYAVQRQGLKSDRILIQIPGVDDPGRVKELVAKPAFLEFKKVVTPPSLAGTRYPGGETREQVVQQFGGQLPADVEVFEADPNSFGGRKAYYPLTIESPVSGNDLITARTGRGELGSAEVQFTLSPDAGARFEKFTGESIGQPLAALLDKKIIQIATIQARIRENGRITGIGSLQEADDLSLKLRSGALPASTTVLEERTVGPSLGADSIKRGVFSALTGLICCVVFMLVYYKGAGINAVLALVLNVLMLLGIMSYLGATLTLPGIAGVILTFGMALDANILVFERVREELRNGKTVRSSIEAGFGKVFWTLFDTHLTTVIAAVLLFNFGTGPVKGFALTLVIGLAASMFTAIFVSRLIFELSLGEGKRVERLSI